MLSLVAYGNSDDSGSDGENECKSPAETVVIPNGEPKTNVQGASDDSSAKSDDCPSRKDRPTESSVVKEGNKPLSLPSSQMTSINFDLKILDKKRSQPIRITIPSLKDLAKDEEPDKKPKLKPSTKGSGLFSLLPEPKNVTTSVSKILMPQSVANAKKTKSKKHSSHKAKANEQKANLLDDDEEEEGGEALSSFFFSSPNDVPLPPVDMSLDIPIIASNVSSSLSIASNHPADIGGSVGLDSRMLSQNGGLYSSSISDSLITSPPHTYGTEEPSLDSAALMKLCGARDRKKGPDLSEIIDVNGSSLVGDSSLQLAKELSKEQPTHSFKRKSECSSLQRRKHQITYLAEQAKAQELELRNNWAQNRMTRKQTQAKYGF